MLCILREIGGNLTKYILGRIFIAEQKMQVNKNTSDSNIGRENCTFTGLASFRTFQYALGEYFNLFPPLFGTHYYWLS